VRSGTTQGNRDCVRENKGNGWYVLGVRVRVCVYGVKMDRKSKDLQATGCKNIRKGFSC
jgi:hypothetical protein